MLQGGRPLQPPPPPHVRGDQVRGGVSPHRAGLRLQRGPRHLPPGAPLLRHRVRGLPGLPRHLHLPQVQVQGAGQAEVSLHRRQAGRPDRLRGERNHPGPAGADQRLGGGPATPRAENHRQAGPDDGQDWGGEVRRGLGSQVEGREGGRQGFLHHRGGLLVQGDRNIPGG